MTWVRRVAGVGPFRSRSTRPESGALAWGDRLTPGRIPVPAVKWFRITQASSTGMSMPSARALAMVMPPAPAVVNTKKPARATARSQRHAPRHAMATMLMRSAPAVRAPATGRGLREGTQQLATTRIRALVQAGVVRRAVVKATASSTSTTARAESTPEGMAPSGVTSTNSSLPPRKAATTDRMMMASRDGRGRLDRSSR